MTKIQRVFLFPFYESSISGQIPYTQNLSLLFDQILYIDQRLNISKMWQLKKGPIVMSWWKFSTLYWVFPLLMDLELFSSVAITSFSIRIIIGPLFVHYLSIFVNWSISKWLEKTFCFIDAPFLSIEFNFPFTQEAHFHYFILTNLTLITQDGLIIKKVTATMKILCKASGVLIYYICSKMVRHVISKVTI